MGALDPASVTGMPGAAGTVVTASRTPTAARTVARRRDIGAASQPRAADAGGTAVGSNGR